MSWSAISLWSYSISHSDDFDSWSKDKTSNPRSIEQFSSFGDSACGEPLLAQHIQLDFTPDDEIDNQIVEQKISDFWKFITENPYIKNLKVKPEKNSYSRPSTTVEAEEDPRDSVCSRYDENVLDSDKSALSNLEVIGKKGIIARTIATKMKHSICSFGSKEYKENETYAQNNGTRRKSRTPKVCKCNTSKSCRGQKPISEVQLLCNTLTEWDAKHPKSMEPPGQAPLLHHCVIQPQVFP